MIKTILVHLAGTDADSSVLVQALDLAGPLGAHLECLHVRPGLGQLVDLVAPSASGPGVEINVGEVLEELKLAAAERAGKARATFDDICGANNIAIGDAPPASGLNAAFREEQGDETEVLVEKLRANDFVVIGGGGVEGGLRPDVLAHLLLTSGRPLLLSPPVPIKDSGRTIAIAWKSTPESARAVAAAIPLLANADKVVVLSASEGKYDADENATRPVLSHLRWHGIDAELREVLPAGRSASEAVLAGVRDVRADLLVMGAYGRGRLAEIVFGGFTRQILTNTELPVFLLH